MCGVRNDVIMPPGLLVGNPYDDQKVVDVMVQGTPKTQANTNLADLLIDTPTGSLVRLGDVATVRVVPFPTIIRHSAASRSLDVTANVYGRDISSVLGDVKYQVLTVQMPTEYHAEVFSDLATEQSRDLRLAGLAIGAVVAMLLLLQAAFGSWRMAGVLLLDSATGLRRRRAECVLCRRRDDPLGAIMGLFALFGIAAATASPVDPLLPEPASINGTSKRLDIVWRATRENAGPIMLAAGATTAALIPVLLFGSVAGTEVLFPLAVVIVGGPGQLESIHPAAHPTMYLGFAPAPTHDLVYHWRSMEAPTDRKSKSWSAESREDLGRSPGRLIESPRLGRLRG